MLPQPPVGSWSFEGKPLSPWRGSRRPKAGALAPMPSPDAPLCSVPAGGDRPLGCGRFLTFFFFLLEMETLLPATWQESEVPGRATQAKDISAVAGGRPHWLAVWGGRGATAAASLLAYLLLNFSGCFSLITWNLCAIEASWKRKKRRQKSLVSGGGHEVWWEETHIHSWNAQILEIPNYRGAAPSSGSPLSLLRA